MSEETTVLRILTDAATATNSTALLSLLEQYEGFANSAWDYEECISIDTAKTVLTEMDAIRGNLTATGVGYVPGLSAAMVGIDSMCDSVAYPPNEEDDVFESAIDIINPRMHRIQKGWCEAQDDATYWYNELSQTIAGAVDSIAVLKSANDRLPTMTLYRGGNSADSIFWSDSILVGIYYSYGRFTNETQCPVWTCTGQALPVEEYDVDNGTCIPTTATKATATIAITEAQAKGYYAILQEVLEDIDIDTGRFASTLECPTPAVITDEWFAETIYNLANKHADTIREYAESYGYSNTIQYVDNDKDTAVAGILERLSS